MQSFGTMNQKKLNKKVLVGVVGYKSEKHIKQCIMSVLEQSHPNIETIYLDNYCQDKAISIVKNNFKTIKCISSPENLGYGRSHNLLMSNYDYDYYLPLNPDVVLDPDFISEALSHFDEANAFLGAINGLVLFLNGTLKTECIYSCGHIMHKDRRIDNFNSGKNTKDVNIETRPLFGPNGACPLLKKEMIIDISINGHFFDPIFFMYGDDIDIGWRMSKAGWWTSFSPSCKAWHMIGGSNPFQSKTIRAEYIANRYILLLKNDNIYLFLRDLPFILFLEIFFFVIHSIKRPSFMLDFFSAMIKVVKYTPYALRSRKMTIKRIDLPSEKKLIEKNYIERILTLIMRQSSRKQNLSTFK